ncbi:MAG: GIY-YIG nuclease family protein [Clostridia bacterium]
MILVFEEVAKNIVVRVFEEISVKTIDLRSYVTNELNKKGSIIYILKDKYNDILYIGETGQSINNRLQKDGNGSHKYKEWFNDVVIVDIYYGNWDIAERKMVEQAFIFMLCPRYNQQQ